MIASCDSTIIAVGLFQLVYGFALGCLWCALRSQRPRSTESPHGHGPA